MENSKKIIIYTQRCLGCAHSHEIGPIKYLAKKYGYSIDIRKTHTFKKNKEEAKKILSDKNIDPKDINEDSTFMYVNDTIISIKNFNESDFKKIL